MWVKFVSKDSLFANYLATRGATNLLLKNPHTNVYKSTFEYFGAMQFNKLPGHIISMKTDAARKSYRQLFHPDWGSSVWRTDGWCWMTGCFCIHPKLNTCGFNRNNKGGYSHHDWSVVEREQLLAVSHCRGNRLKKSGSSIFAGWLRGGDHWLPLNRASCPHHHQQQQQLRNQYWCSWWVWRNTQWLFFNHLTAI